MLLKLLFLWDAPPPLHTRKHTHVFNSFFITNIKLTLVTTFMGNPQTSGLLHSKKQHRNSEWLNTIICKLGFYKSAVGWWLLWKHTQTFMLRTEGRGAKSINWQLHNICHYVKYRLLLKLKMYIYLEGKESMIIFKKTTNLLPLSK